ncbi:MAG: hypothetical protein JSS12_09300 [Verrucomicrobia bacterium]|nr:hypothetical protein [Verrucomicrobiota bacterium]
MSSPTSALATHKLIRLEATEDPQVGLYNGREVDIPSIKKKLRCEEVHISNGDGKLATIFLKITEKNISEK